MGLIYSWYICLGLILPLLALTYYYFYKINRQILRKRAQIFQDFNQKHDIRGIFITSQANYNQKLCDEIIGGFDINIDLEKRVDFCNENGLQEDIISQIYTKPECPVTWEKEYEVFLGPGFVGFIPLKKRFGFLERYSRMKAFPQMQWPSPYSP